MMIMINNFKEINVFIYMLNFCYVPNTWNYSYCTQKSIAHFSLIQIQCSTNPITYKRRISNTQHIKEIRCGL